MKTRTMLVFAISLLAAASSPAADKRRDPSSAAPLAESAATSSPTKDFDAFQVILERNIFNPNRTGKTRATQEEKPPRVDEIALVGTMQYDQGLVAFFHSADSAFRKAVRQGDAIDEFTVQRISSDGVELRRGENTIALKVTQQLRRAEGGDWAVTSAPASVPDSRASVADAAGAHPSAPVEIPADASEVLKRLMKKREKQLK